MKSRLGKRFGFIRFVGVADIDRMIISLCDVWFGYYKMFFSTPRVSNSDKPSPTIFHTASKMEKIVTLKHSYVSVVRGTPTITPVNDKVDEIIHISFGDFTVEKRKRACFVKARDFLTLPNLRMLCFDE